MRADGQVGVEDHQHVVPGLLEPEPDGVALAGARLLDVDDLALGMELDLAQDLLAGPVGRVALDEDQLARPAELRRLGDDPLDHPGLVLRRHDDRDAQLLRLLRRSRPGDDPARQAEVADHPGVGEDAVQERREERDLQRQEDPARRVTGSSPASCRRFVDVLDRHPVADRRARLQPQALEQREDRPPELAVGVDDDPGVAVRVGGGRSGRAPAGRRRRGRGRRGGCSRRSRRGRSPRRRHARS